MIGARGDLVAWYTVPKDGPEKPVSRPVVAWYAEGDRGAPAAMIVVRSGYLQRATEVPGVAFIGLRDVADPAPTAEEAIRALEAFEKRKSESANNNKGRK